MPVQIFIGRAPEGHPLPPNYSHEMTSIIEIIKGLWTAFDHYQPYYAIAANLADPSADLMLISERGIGVIELKHYYGHISCRSNGRWYAGPKQMVAGVEGRGYKNPHEQVQAYTEAIRKKLIEPPPWHEPWLPGKTIDWPHFKFHSAVCFTHPDADLTGFDENLRKRCRPVTLPWEDFSILRIDDVPSWAASLRFEVGSDRSKGFARHQLTPQQINRFLKEVFELSYWDEIRALMPSEHPFAFLALMEKDRMVQIFGLDREEITIGRDLNTCDVPVPERFFLVSRLHARIFRTVDGVFIEDMNSTNGTFVNKNRVQRRVKLKQGATITLGGGHPNEGVCKYQVSFNVDEIVSHETTRKLILPSRKSTQS